jgi:hypothetical protein
MLASSGFQFSKHPQSGEKPMIRLIAFAAFALALPTSAQAMSAPPLHRADGMTTETQDVGYRYRGVGRYGGV